MSGSVQRFSKNADLMADTHAWWQRGVIYQVYPRSFLDTDGDGLPNVWEMAHGFNPLSASDAQADADGDGWTNLEEYLMGTDPRRATVHLQIIAPPNAVFVPGS